MHIVAIVLLQLGACMLCTGKSQLVKKFHSATQRLVKTEIQRTSPQIQKIWLKIRLGLGSLTTRAPARENDMDLKNIAQNAYEDIKAFADSAEKTSRYVYIASAGSLKSEMKFKIPLAHFDIPTAVKKADLCIPEQFSEKRLNLKVLLPDRLRTRRKITFDLNKFDLERSNKNGWPCFQIKKIFQIKRIASTVFDKILLRYAFVKLNTHGVVPGKDKKLMPLLHLELVGSSRKLTKRGLNCGKGNQKRCCRVPLKIRFSDIGYDNVILAPTEFNAYMCKGYCAALTFHQSLRADLLKSYNSQMRRRSNFEPVQFCCTATRTSSLTVLVRDGKFIHSKEIEGLVTEECGCN